MPRRIIILEVEELPRDDPYGLVWVRASPVKGRSGKVLRGAMQFVVTHEEFAENSPFLKAFLSEVASRAVAEPFRKLADAAGRVHKPLRRVVSESRDMG